MVKQIILLIFGLLLHIVNSYAQNDTLSPWRFSGYAEIYYSYDVSEPQQNNKASFIYNHKRHNEVNANLILARAAYQKNKVRANASLMAGNYPQYNLSAEPTWAQFIYEASIGVKLSNTQAIWLEAGIFPSHIGFESAISSDCWNLTRSIAAENSPYFESGIKCSYQSPSGKLNMVVLGLNGWQRISRPAYSQLPAGGFQINYKPTEKWILNYSTFLGSLKPDSLNAIRQFHNFYVQAEPTKRIGFILGFDIGQDKYNDTNYGVWYTPLAVVRLGLTKQLKLGVRAEYYNDAKQIQIASNTKNGFQVWGSSINLDYLISEGLQLRVEAKQYKATDPLFSNRTENYYLTGSLAIQF